MKEMLICTITLYYWYNYFKLYFFVAYFSRYYKDN